MKLKISLKRYFSLKLVDFACPDRITSRNVYIYEDCYGDRWLKNSRWSLFAVQTN